VENQYKIIYEGDTLRIKGYLCKRCGMMLPPSGEAITNHQCERKTSDAPSDQPTDPGSTKASGVTNGDAKA
jgi:hypothetical protein